MIKNLKNKILSYTMIKKFLSDLKEKSWSGDNETMKVVKLEKVE